MNCAGIFGRLKHALGIDRSEKFPREIIMRRFIKDGCRFEISAPIEAFRIEQYGDEEEFTGTILDGIRPGDVFLDIGACVGLVTVHAAKKGAMVYAFEPDPYYRSRLTANLRLNGQSNVQVVDWAVSDVEGEVTLFTDGVGGNSPSLRDIGDRGTVKVKTDFIDNALRRGEIPAPDVIKLDIEGAEILALRGMQELLVSDKGPRAIFIEIHPDYLKDFDATVESVEELLHKSGYVLDCKLERSSQLHCIFKKAPVYS